MALGNWIIWDIKKENVEVFSVKIVKMIKSLRNWKMIEMRKLKDNYCVLKLWKRKIILKN